MRKELLLVYVIAEISACFIGAACAESYGPEPVNTSSPLRQQEKSFTISGRITLPNPHEPKSLAKPGKNLMSAACKVTSTRPGIAFVSDIKQEYSLYLDDRDKLCAIMMKGTEEQDSPYFHTATLLVITPVSDNSYRIDYYSIVNAEEKVRSWNNPIANGPLTAGALNWGESTACLSRKLDSIFVVVNKDHTISIKQPI